jgi:hypothetical protein
MKFIVSIEPPWLRTAGETPGKPRVSRERRASGGDCFGFAKAGRVEVRRRRVERVFQMTDLRRSGGEQTPGEIEG